MFGKIIFSLLSFLIFIYIFIFKLIKKNDTTYLILLGIQAIGILLNFIQILFNVLTSPFFICIAYIFCIIIPVVVALLEFKGINASELLSIGLSKIFLLAGNRKKAKKILNNIIIKYDKSYKAHRTLAEIYKEEGRNKKSNR